MRTASTTPATAWVAGDRRRAHGQFEPDINAPLIEFHHLSGPFAGAGQRHFTKLHGRYVKGVLRLRLNRDRTQWILDDIFWSLAKIQYVHGSKQVVPVQRLSGVASMTAAQRKAFWAAYYEFSDHLPVKADFQELSARGMAVKDILSRILLTPACGLGYLDLETATRALALLADLSARGRR